jgi:uncharacterized protein (TIGR02646 family)
VYAAEPVKEPLRAAQHDKCAFCESKFRHTGYGDVEHFRPKAGYRQAETDPLQRPGYYWLAYTWGNLLVSCQLCNQRFKRNLFPLRDPSARALSHTHSTEDERPLLIDPAADNPGKDLAFRQEYAYPVRASRKGRTTIAVFGLNREELVEVRRDRLQKLKLLRDARNRLLETAKPLSDEAKKFTEEIGAFLKDAVRAAAEYAAMNRALLREGSR